MNDIIVDAESRNNLFMGEVTNCKTLNIRENPSGSASILGSIPIGSIVMVDESESTDKFYKVYTESGAEGFCMKDYIEIQYEEEFYGEHIDFN